jgi:hypothetical protein
MSFKSIVVPLASGPLPLTIPVEDHTSVRIQYTVVPEENLIAIHTHPLMGLRWVINLSEDESEWPALFKAKLDELAADAGMTAYRVVPSHQVKSLQPVAVAFICNKPIVNYGLTMDFESKSVTVESSFTDNERQDAGMHTQSLAWDLEEHIHRALQKFHVPEECTIRFMRKGDPVPLQTFPAGPFNHWLSHAPLVKL